MTYSESESGFSFAINSLSDFDSASKSNFNYKSESDSESDFSSVFMNLDIFIFSPYIYTLLNKFADNFFINSHSRINSYASNASIMHIFFWHIIVQKVCFITPSNSPTLAFMYFWW